MPATSRTVPDYVLIVPVPVPVHVQGSGSAKSQLRPVYPLRYLCTSFRNMTWPVGTKEMVGLHNKKAFLTLAKGTLSFSPSLRT